MKYAWAMTNRKNNYNHAGITNGWFDTIEDAIENAKYKLRTYDGECRIVIVESVEYDYSQLYVNLLDSVLKMVQNAVYDQTHFINENAEYERWNLSTTRPGDYTEHWSTSYTCRNYPDRIDAYTKANNKLIDLVADYTKEIGNLPHYIKVGRIIRRIDISCNETL